MPLGNARNASRGLQVGDLSAAARNMPSRATPGQRAAAENMARETLDGLGLGISKAQIAGGLAGGGLLTVGLGGVLTDKPESKGAPDSLSRSQVPLSEPTVPTEMGQVTGTIEQGTVADPQTADNPMQPLVDEEIAKQVQNGMDTGAAQLDPIPQYTGPQPAARIQTAGDNREAVRSQVQQSKPTGLAKYYAERATAASNPGVNEATVAELQKLGVLNTPELAQWGQANPMLAYDLLERTKAARPTLPSQQSINVTGVQLMSPMGSDIGRNAIGNTEAKMNAGNSYGADMSAATQAYSAPTIQPVSPAIMTMPVGNNRMYNLQGRLSY